MITIYYINAPSDGEESFHIKHDIDYPYFFLMRTYEVIILSTLSSSFISICSNANCNELWHTVNIELDDQNTIKMKNDLDMRFQNVLPFTPL